MLILAKTLKNMAKKSQHKLLLKVKRHRYLMIWLDATCNYKIWVSLHHNLKRSPSWLSIQQGLKIPTNLSVHQHQSLIILQLYTSKRIIFITTWRKKKETTAWLSISSKEALPINSYIQTYSAQQRIMEYTTQIFHNRKKGMYLIFSPWIYRDVVKRVIVWCKYRLGCHYPHPPILQTHCIPKSNEVVK